MKKISIAVTLLLLSLFCTVEAVVDDLPLVRGDTRPAYPIVIRDKMGIVDLTGTTVTATMENYSTGVNIFTDAAVLVTSATAGEAEYRWAGSDTNTVGAFSIQFKVIDAEGNTSTYPTSFKTKVIISERY